MWLSMMRCRKSEESQKSEDRSLGLEVGGQEKGGGS